MLNGVILKLSSHSCQYDSIIPPDFSYVNTEAQSFPPYKARDVVSLGFLCRNIHLIPIFFPPAASPNCSQVWFSCDAFFPFLSHSFPFLFLLGDVCDGGSRGREINRQLGLLFLPQAALIAT